MKRILFSLVIAFTTIGFTKAQIAEDALRFSQYLYGGTSRSMAMGNAFGALGGDFTSLSINPAGIGVYRGSEFVFTPVFNYSLVNSTYLGQSYEDFDYNLKVNNIGFVSTYSGSNSGFVNVNFGIGYNRLRNFDRNLTFLGNNAPHSLLDEFAYNANVGDGSAYYEDLAFNTYLIDYTEDFDNDLALIDHAQMKYLGVSDDLGVYFSEYDYEEVYGSGALYGQNQEININTTGNIGEYTFSLGANYEHKLYMGATVGIQRLYYKEVKDHYEFDDVNDFNLDYFKFHENFETRGTGYNLKAGIIGRPINMLRIGAAVHTPTFYNLESEFYTSADAYYDQPPYDDLNETNYYDRSELLISDYKLVTPFRAIGSVGITLKDKGLISVDYEFADYGNARFRGDDTQGFNRENEVIQNIARITHNLRAGGEILFGPLALRGGYSFYASPYAENELNDDANYSIISGGFGVRTEGFFFDMAVLHNTHPEKRFLYWAYDDSRVIADADMKKISVSATLGFRF